MPNGPIHTPYSNDYSSEVEDSEVILLASPRLPSSPFPSRPIPSPPLLFILLFCHELENSFMVLYNGDEYVCFPL